MPKTMKRMPHPSHTFRGRVGILTLFYRVTHGSLAKSLQSAKCDRRGKIIGPVSDGKPDTNSSPYQGCAIARSLVRVRGGKTSNVRYFSLLKTIEAGLLSYINHAADPNVKLLTDLLDK
jgi:hypothetical protein